MNHISTTKQRLKIAFFDYPDVFEDFYPHYGVSQEKFSTVWMNTANHQFIRLIQNEIGDVTWYVNSIKPKVKESTHQVIGCKIKFLPSSLAHRIIWKFFYRVSFSWKWHRFYRLYATIASYLAPLSWRLWKSLRKDNPDIFFVQDYCSGKYDILILFASMLNLPLIARHSGSTLDKYLGMWIRKHTLKRADWIFSLGANEQKLLEQKFGIDNRVMAIIRPPININFYKPTDRNDACLKAGLDSNKRYILFVGRLQDSIKRITATIKVFSKVAVNYEDVELLIVGSGTDERYLKKLANEICPERIQFMGWITDDMTKAILYNVSECLVLNSWREGSPTVIGEALSCGIPVISSNVGEINDLVIHNKTGWLFPAGQDELFYQYLVEALDNPGNIKKMRKYIRKTAIEKVSEQAIIKSLKKGFSSIKVHEN